MASLVGELHAVRIHVSKIERLDLPSPREDAHTPRLQHGCIRQEELLPTEIPAARKLRLNLLILTKQDRGRIQNSSFGLQHVGIDLNAIVGQISIARPVQQPKTSSNGGLTALRSSNGEFDHGSSLRLIQLEWVTLPFG